MSRALDDMLDSVLLRHSFNAKGTFVGSSDIDLLQMVEQANKANIQFRRFYPWRTLKKTDTITMDGSLAYDLASDFDYLVPESAYKTTSGIPVDLPASDELWGWLGANSNVSGRTYIGQIIGGQLVLAQEVTGDVITYDYISKHAVQATGGGSTKERFTADTDVFLLDEEVFLLGVEAHWSKAKGFDDAPQLMGEFKTAMRNWIGNDSGAKTIRPYRRPRRGPWSDAMSW